MGSFLGYFVGILPAAGATPGSLMAYGIAKHDVEGARRRSARATSTASCAPEAANNAASTGSMLPMLTLGIPGSPTTAILLGGMVIWGLEPGPRLFTEQTEFVWGLIASLYAANLFALHRQHRLHPGLHLGAEDARSPSSRRSSSCCASIGGYAPTQDMHDVWLMLIFGVVGYLMRKLDYPMAPAVLAIVLGPLGRAADAAVAASSRRHPRIFFTVRSGPIMVVALILRKYSI